MRTFESLHRLVWYRLEVTKICNTEDKKEHKIYYGFFFCFTCVCIIPFNVGNVILEWNWFIGIFTWE